MLASSGTVVPPLYDLLANSSLTDDMTHRHKYYTLPLDRLPFVDKRTHTLGPLVEPCRRLLRLEIRLGTKGCGRHGSVDAFGSSLACLRVLLQNGRSKCLVLECLGVVPDVDAQTRNPPCTIHTPTGCLNRA